MLDTVILTSRAIAVRYSARHSRVSVTICQKLELKWDRHSTSFQIRDLGGWQWMPNLGKIDGVKGRTIVSGKETRSKTEAGYLGMLATPHPMPTGTHAFGMEYRLKCRSRTRR